MSANSLHVLKRIDFDVKEGELISIMESSGSGKCTLLNKYLGFIIQFFNLINYKSSLDNIALMTERIANLKAGAMIIEDNVVEQIRTSQYV